MYGVPCVGKLLLHAAWDDKPPVNIKRHFDTFTHTLTYYTSEVSPSHPVERKALGYMLMLYNHFSARASFQPDVPTDDCWKTLEMTQLLVWMVFPLYVLWHLSSCMFGPDKLDWSRFPGFLTNINLWVVPQLASDQHLLEMQLPSHWFTYCTCSENIGTVWKCLGWKEGFNLIFHFFL